MMNDIRLDSLSIPELQLIQESISPQYIGPEIFPSFHVQIMTRHNSLNSFHEKGSSERMEPLKET